MDRLKGLLEIVLIAGVVVIVLWVLFGSSDIAPRGMDYITGQLQVLVGKLPSLMRIGGLLGVLLGALIAIPKPGRTFGIDLALGGFVVFILSWAALPILNWLSAHGPGLINGVLSSG
jgi:hypothetical protein